MSASNELLLEQIKKTEEALAVAKAQGDSVALVSLQQRLQTLHTQFNASSSALTEGKAVLKG